MISIWGLKSVACSERERTGKTTVFQAHTLWEQGKEPTNDMREGSIVRETAGLADSRLWSSQQWSLIRSLGFNNRGLGRACWSEDWDLISWSIISEVKILSKP